MKLDRAIAALPLGLALCLLTAAASAQVRAPSAIASRPVPAAAARAAPSLDPTTVLAYTQQQLAQRDAALQQKKQGMQSGKDTEINMLKLQSDVSKRSNMVQVTSNLLKSQAGAASAARNIGH